MTILNIQNTSLRFPNADKASLYQINYQIQKGDFIILLGSNGSGKSSLLKLLYRQYHSSQGDVYLKGKSISHYSNRSLNKKIVMLNQHCSDSLFPSLNIYENYLLINKKSTFCQHRIQKQKLCEYLKDFNPHLCDKLNTLVYQLSGGERQALALAFCLLRSPSILLLDEHTSALDPKTSAHIMHLTQHMIIKHQLTCILTTHNLDIALNYGNRILILHEGKILKTIEAYEKPHLSKTALVEYYSNE